MKPRGLGDTVHNAIRVVRKGKPCATCKKVENWLNKKFPYQKNAK